MRIPTVKGEIDRRILTNYRVDPTVIKAVLPQPFRAKLVNGYAIAGICLIRLANIRPRFFPFPWGFGSENAAHRIAVEWDTSEGIREGVYIPRRDTTSRLNTIVGGRIFPGVHHHARFEVKESDSHLSIKMNSDDGSSHIGIKGKVTNQFPTESVFGSLEKASEFFKKGSLGYSATREHKRFDGLELMCDDWSVKPLEVELMESSFFQDESRFPKGSVMFDCALLMRNIKHEWHSRAELCCTMTIGA